MFSRIQRKGAIVVAALVVLLAPQLAQAQADVEMVITGEGIGEAVLGQTPEELAQALGDDYFVSDEVRITVDLNGRVVNRTGDVQFRAAMTDDSDKLTLFIVSNPAHKTAEGVGATTTIAEAEAIYGDATLRLIDGSREFVSFANGPDDRISFRTPGIGGTTLGIYDGDATETTEYAPGGAIAAVWIQCEPGTNCPGDDGAPAADPTVEPTATPEAEPTATPEPEAEPTATPEPEPTATPESNDDAGDTGSDDALARTGVTELVMLAIAATLVFLGGMMVLAERHAHPGPRSSG